MAVNASFTGRMRWSEAMEDLLIELWRQSDCLYNVSSDTYYNKAQQERCWEEIAAALELPVEEVKMRAVSLRTQYSKLLRPLGDGGKNRAMTLRQRRILTSLNFLKTHIPRPNESSLNQTAKDTWTSQRHIDDSEPESTALSPDPAAVRTTWSEEKEDQFLELWQQHDCLYNLSADRSHNRVEREKKWAEIATALDLSVEDIKLRATTLRTQYGRLVKSLGSARKKKPMTLRQRRILKSCNFLKKHISHRVTDDNHNNDVLRTQQDSEPPNQAQPWDFDGRAPPSPTESLSVSPPPQSATNNRNNDMEGQNAALLQHMLDVIQETSRQQLRDSEDSFGVTVAMELKRIQNPALRNGVKRQIMTILYDALDSEVVTHPACLWGDESNGCLPRPQHTEESPSITVVIP